VSAVIEGTDLWTLAVFLGLAGVTVLTRCFFFILVRPWGLGFAGVLCLVGILCSLANTPLRQLSALIAGAAAVAAYAMPLKLNIVIAIVVAVLVSFWLEKRWPPAWRQPA
jgi:predicted branched-subunit amino acid permease